MERLRARISGAQIVAAARWLRGHATTLGDLIGALVVALGVALVYLPAGVIVLGFFVLLASQAAASRRVAAPDREGKP